MVRTAYRLLLLLVIAADCVSAQSGAANDPGKLRAMCDRKEVFGCYRLGTLYAAGAGVTKDLSKALALFESVCTKTESRGCAAVDCYSERPERCGVYAADAANQEHAVELHSRACQAGVATSCFALGQIRDRGFQDYVGAGDYYERACRMSDPEACFHLGVLYSVGLGRQADQARAAALWEQACDGNFSRGCFNTVLEYATGRRKPRSLEYAASVYRKACDAGQGQGCWELGKAYAAGAGVRKDAGQALDALSKACREGGIKEACADAIRVR